jgi:small basic protein (TIGR04137 family)
VQRAEVAERVRPLLWTVNQKGAAEQGRWNAYRGGTPSRDRRLPRGATVSRIGAFPGVEAGGPAYAGRAAREVSGPMSIDKSLKKAGTLARARNVLTRAERLAVLQEDDRWKAEQGVFNLPKTKYRRLAPGQSGPRRPTS